MPTTSLTPNPTADLKRMYARALSAWAVDLIRLRSSGADVPSRREGDGDLVSPSFAFGPWLAVEGPEGAAQKVRWHEQRRAA